MMAPCRAAFAAVCLCASCLAAGAEAPRRPDTFVARLEALASMETLNASILGSRSATLVLERWCADHAMAAPAKIRAERVDGPPKPPSAEQRARLQIGPDEPVRYRHVRLACGPHVLSEADNWYVPARLTPEMNRVLDTTETPFGKVVAPLKPTRQTLGSEVLWPVLPDGWDRQARPPDHPDRDLDPPPILFQHQALLYDTQRRPICEVAEHYTREILAFGRRPD